MHAAAPHDPSTAVVSLGRPARKVGAALNPAIAMSSTFVGVTTPEGGEDRGYARFSNETWEPLESAIGVLEGSHLPALAYASGMAAVSAALSLVPVGGTVLVPTTSYNGTIGLARSLASHGAITLREIDPGDTESTIAQMTDADLVWLESPTNPLLEVIDLPLLIGAARERGLMTVVDNTFSTPLRQRPLAFGADIVVHSATKFIAGHSDVLLGLVVVADAKLRARLLAQRTLHGAVPGPFEAWLALRGLRTLALRLDRAEASAGVLAERLQTAPGVERVRYPGLRSDPGYTLATAQLTGYGALVSVEIAGGAARAERFVEGLELITPATSLGGVETLAERRRRQTAEPLEVPESLVRLSIGIEHVEDLWADLEQALERASA
ncbi:MAG: aminotransferase class I/II-fold pyridoxal phosphate-dependent enzyme [Leucobacter sp.]